MLAASVCGTIAASWSVVHLRAVAGAMAFEPEVLSKAVRRRATADDLRGVLGAAPESAEAELFSGVMGAATVREARSRANAALIELGDGLPLECPVRASCVRIALLGTVLGIALLVAGGRAMSTELLDVFAIGGGAAIVSWVAGAETKKLVERKRKAIDELVERLMEVRWGAGWAGDQEQSAPAVQPREPRDRRSVDGEVTR